MMIEKKHNINPITFSWIFTIIFSLYFLSNDTNFGLTPWWTLLVICFFIVAVFSKKGILQLRITSEKICYLIMFIVILGNFFRTDSRHDSSTEAYIISFTIFVIYMLFCESEKKTLLKCGKYLQIFSLILSMLVIFFSFNKSLYWSTFGSLLSEAEIKYQQSLDKYGYGTVFGGVAFTAYIIVLGLIISISKLKYNKENKKFINIISIIIGILALIVIGRRSELFFFIITFAFTSIAVGNNAHRLLKLILIVILGLFAYFILLYMLPYLAKIPVFSRYVTLINGILNNSNAATVTVGRTSLWVIAIKLFRNNPFFGIGWGGFAPYIPGSWKIMYGETLTDVHNIYLQLLCEIGLFGAVPIFISLLIPFINVLKKINDCIYERRNYDDIGFLYCSLSIQIFFLLLGIMDPCFTKIIYLALLGISFLLNSVIDD